VTRAEQKASTRLRLLAAAREQFTEGSIVDTPLETVARRAGCSKATVFFHFATRSELLTAVAAELSEELAGELAEEPASEVVEEPAAELGDRLPSLHAVLARFLDLQRDRRSRLLWETGDVLAAAGRPLPDVAFHRLTGELAARADVDERAARVLAAAAFLMGRRVAFGQAGPADVLRFLDDVDAVARPT
jgi:AcrR family transcriptional regulator